MSELNVALTLIGGLILVFGLLAGFMKSKVYFLSEPLVAVIVGVVIGPAGFGWLHIANWADPITILEQVARLTVGLSVLSIALRIPRTYFTDQLEAMGTLLIPGQIVMCAVSGLLTYWLLGLPFWVGMLVGAVVTPTDPVLASSIVTGETARRNIPDRLIQLLSGEAGANDGLAYPLVFLAIFMINHPLQQALSRWVVGTLLWDVTAAVLVGLAIGAAAGWIQEWSEEKDFIEQTSLLTVTVALTFAVLGAVHLMGSDGILAAFAAGLGFNRIASGSDESEEQNVTEVVKRLFTFPIFVLFGIALPWGEWFALGWTGVALAVGVLLLRRLPMMFAFRRFIPPLQRTADTAFAGWFGPIGVAAIYYATLAHHKIGSQEPWVIGSLIIAISVLVFGVTATPFTKLYGREMDQGS